MTLLPGESLAPPQPHTQSRPGGRASDSIVAHTYDDLDTSDLGGYDFGGDEELTTAALHERLVTQCVDAGALERQRLATIRSLGARRAWREDDFRDLAHYVAFALGIGSRRATRITDCAYAIESLPRISAALVAGVLSIDKVMELTRFATPETEAKLINWAKRVAPSTIAARADAELAQQQEQQQQQASSNYLRFSKLENSMLMMAEMPIDAGLQLEAVVDAMAKTLVAAPVLAPIDQTSLSGAPVTGDVVDQLEAYTLDRRRLDALRALVAGGSNASVTTEVVVHTKLSALGFSNSVAGHALVLGPQVTEKICCDARLRFVLTDDDGNALGIGRASRVVPSWLRQQVLARDNFSCTFPGCDQRLGLEVHHTAHWAYGGSTDLSGLSTNCGVHHDLVHLHDWRQAVRADGITQWYRPDGTPFVEDDP
jgi:hypothetical protein